MAVETTRITGNVLLPTGAAASGGRIRVRLSTPSTVADGGTSHVVGVAPYDVQIGTNGAVDFFLVPNDVLTPAGTHYLMQFETLDGFSWSERVTVATSPDPTTIGALTRL